MLVMGGGSVALADPKSVGTWTIGRGVEAAEDRGAGALATRWTVTNLPENRKAVFKLVGGDFTCMVIGTGTVISLR